MRMGLVNKETNKDFLFVDIPLTLFGFLSRHSFPPQP